MCQDVGCCDLICHTNTVWIRSWTAKQLGLDFGVGNFVHAHISTSNWMLEILLIWFSKGRTVPKAYFSFAVPIGSFVQISWTELLWFANGCSNGVAYCLSAAKRIDYPSLKFSRCVIAGSTDIISCPVLMPHSHICKQMKTLPWILT